MVKPLSLTRAGKLRIQESEISRQINEWLALLGWRCVRTTAAEIVAGTHRKVNESGTPDWICTRRGAAIWREDKAEGGKLRPAQVVWIFQALQDGERVIYGHRSLAEFKALYRMETEGRAQPLWFQPITRADYDRAVLELVKRKGRRR